MDEIRLNKRERDYAKTGMRTCPICGEKFYTPFPESWCYKIKIKSRPKFVCSYGCMRKHQKEQENKRK